MAISVTCSQCEKKFKVADTSAGKKLRCSACKGVITVPEVEEEEVEEEVVEEEEAEEEEGYGVDEEDEEEREERRRERKRKEKKRNREDARARRRSYKPHHAGTILVRAILSVFACCILPAGLLMAYLAITMANEDLAEMS